MKKRKIEEIDAEASSGNVFEDLGLPDAKERYTKTLLSIMIAQIIEKRKLSQAEAARILSTTQAKISTVCTGRLKDVSLEKLLEFLTKLDKDVEIRIKSKPRSHAVGEISVAM